MLPTAVFLLGPTASGKTALSLALAERFPVEIVSVDSAQVYRGMDVGTAKPDAAIRAQVRHHLIDIVPPTEPYSAGRFRDDALRLSREIAARGRIVLFVGGTMLYERALARGLAELPAANPELRSRIDERARERGWPALHAELARVDPVLAARIKPSDAQRIQRGLEVFETSGSPLSVLQALAAPAATPFNALRIALEPSDRALLHRRIEQRFHDMLANGLLAELDHLRHRHALHARLPSMRAVGYRQAWEVLEGTAPAATLAERGIVATRRLAKRQLTWLRSRTDVVRLDCLRSDLAGAASAQVARFVEATPQSSP